MIDRVIADIEANKDASVERLVDFLRIPSISTDPDCKPDMGRAAEWVNAYFTECGLSSEVVETAGHPAILADSGPAEGDGPTVDFGRYCS